ncbi:D-alanyl-D-alanine carboxypeptidase/D-alanyl-D-alanine-endopeptidase [Robbsia sp. Bb-Pol-6]|uniref:D-alanyl-D-alanine carboxypeptidase/D-alanyl-D-alanine-endopeptidase n=1 Tax=Robbsia betulipollinis TaxID=2981849 RepID=A0ABT3ZMM2_9BURK|nr:D-alanyl-D-alanine carboxypeptidase/D-alanyl-D-alanine-endopeptidase [Robbsia betulipollinis]MCY0387510.1 D-alanyl-D-alanine carboxypeptidase/D-alanyl-D-alanine-endopeptidase [Robbsia betulipollinis]
MSAAPPSPPAPATARATALSRRVRRALAGCALALGLAPLAWPQAGIAQQVHAPRAGAADRARSRPPERNARDATNTAAAAAKAARNAALAARRASAQRQRDDASDATARLTARALASPAPRRRESTESTRSAPSPSSMPAAAAARIGPSRPAALSAALAAVASARAHAARGTADPDGANASASDTDDTPNGVLPAPVAAALARANIPRASVSALVMRLDDDQQILAVNARRPMTPASTMKVVTTYAGLSMLGADFRWQTSAFADGTLANGVLHGNLYIEGTGDPFLVPEQLSDLVAQIRRAGITQIAGDLVLDKGYFDLSTRDAPPLDDAASAPYNVGPDPLLYAFKALTIDVSPGADGAAQIDIQPPLAQLRIVNDIHMTGGACRAGEANPALSNGADGTLNLRFSGNLSTRCGTQQTNIAVLDHTRFFSGGFLALWQQAGGTFTGTVREAPVPVAAQRIAVHMSPPLSEVIRNMNKFSNNAMARNLYLTIGAVTFKPPATLDGTERMMNRWFKRNHIDAQGLVVDNGSGLARDAAISAETMGELLNSAYRSPVAQPLMDSLPTVGVDGTMRRRLTNSGITGHAQIKTGTLGNVRAIAGYVFAANGHPYVVVSFINDPRSSAGGAAHDALLNWVYNQP